ncbi:RbsD/FucU family protein [Agromyces sp. NPDC055520]
MLSGIHPILGGELLAALDRLGHGDELVVADANFPAHRVGAVVVEAPALSAADVVGAIRTVVPLDGYQGASVLLMAAEGGQRLPVQHELVAAAATTADRVEELERFAFYERARSAQLIVRSGELRPYGNVVLRKGVVNDYTQAEAAR